MALSWDIFCRVVDNYGDIGVTWRLARQLVAEHDAQVRLWVDEPEALLQLCPHMQVAAECQLLSGVDVRHWRDRWQDVEPADVVIEAFACALPGAFITAMAAAEPKPLWLNLEYLSAEDWVTGCHGLPSLQSGGLQKFFFFPGFDAGCGGLLRERGLLERRCAFQQDRLVQTEFLARLGVAADETARRISLFAYENAALGSWLDALAQGTQSTQLLVPEGRILADLKRWLGVAQLKAGEAVQRGALRIHVLPFLSQDDYDRLLWCCDLNAIRGEDSFVRAQWAGRPMLWHIYRQADNAHMEKLEAFLARYLAGLPLPARAALEQFHLDWNRAESVSESWAAVEGSWPQLSEHAEQWCSAQAQQADLATALVLFYGNWISCAT